MALNRGKGEVEFAFDTSSFDEAFKHISRQMGTLINSTEKQTKQATTSVSKGTFSALAKFNVLWSIAKAGFNTIMNSIKTGIPEISTALGYAKDIFFKNLLYPLRKELLPYLQKILNWTTQHRAMFVQWGGVLVNVFRMLKTMFTTLIHLFSPIIYQIKNLLKSIFGDTTKSITETLNMIILKITSFIIFIESILQPIFDTIGGVIGNIITAIKNFAEGFKKSFKIETFMKLIDTIVNGIKDLGTALFGSEEGWRKFGEIMGKVVNIALVTTETLLKSIFDILTGIINLDMSKIAEGLSFGLYKSEKTKQKEMKAYLESTGMGAYFEELKKRTTPKITPKEKETSDWLEEQRKKAGVQDAIITKKGEVIKTSPEDNIIATKGGMGRKVDVNFSFGNMYFNVSEGNARQAGQNFIGGMERQIRNILLDNLILQGSE